MKVVAVFGDDIEKARTRVSAIIAGVKARKWEIVHIDPQNGSLGGQLVSQSLFPVETLYVALDAKKIPAHELDWIRDHTSEIDARLLLYFAGNIPADIKKSLPEDAQYESFSLPKEIFAFLDSFWPGNKKRCLELLLTIEKNESVEFLIAMLGRHLRDLIWIKVGDKGMSALPWRKQKLMRQAERFDEMKLR